MNGLAQARSLTCARQTILVATCSARNGSDIYHRRSVAVYFAGRKLYAELSAWVWITDD
jgi:hypothetical protein